MFEIILNEIADHGCRENIYSNDIFDNAVEWIINNGFELTNKYYDETGYGCSFCIVESNICKGYTYVFSQLSYNGIIERYLWRENNQLPKIKFYKLDGTIIEGFLSGI